MLLILMLFGYISASDIDVPIDAEFDAIPDDQLYKTDTFSFRYTNQLTAPLNTRITKPVMVVVNCMVYWITI